MKTNSFIEYFSKLKKDSNPIIHDYGIISTTDIHFSQDVRNYCEQNACGCYNKNWVCPPAIGTVDECKKIVQSYSHMLVFNQVYPLEDSFDYPGMVDAMKGFQNVCAHIHLDIKKLSDDYFMFGNEGCNMCTSCTYPDAPCRFPDKIHPPLEGFGMFVNELAESTNLSYRNGVNTVTYFGAVLFNENAE